MTIHSGPAWAGPVTVAPLFVLYDYSFRPEGAADKAQAVELAYATCVVCTDEWLLHPDPYPSREAWCRARVEYTERRLAACDPALPTVLVNHYPLVREPTRILRYPEFVQWCGTQRTADWHTRFRAAVIYGHLHVPRTTWHDGSGSTRSRWATRRSGGAVVRRPTRCARSCWAAERGCLVRAV